MNIVTLFSDMHMLPGLHVTLLSMLRALKKEQAPSVKIILYLDAVPKSEQQMLIETHKQCQTGSILEIVEYSPKAPTGGNLLHGNATAYGRINLPRLLPNESRCVYLDCDLIVNRCVTDIFEQFDGCHILLVDGTGKRNYSLDRLLFEQAGMDMAGLCFNSGVMGMDLAIWRERDIDRLVQFSAEKYKGMFKSADQALLNVALHSSFKAIGNEFNTALFPSSPTCHVLEERIYHFVGSPKPWDFLGSFASNHFKIWNSFYMETAISKKWQVRYSSLRRTVQVAKQSFKAIQKKVEQGAALNGASRRE